MRRRAGVRGAKVLIEALSTLGTYIVTRTRCLDRVNYSPAFVAFAPISFRIPIYTLSVCTQSEDFYILTIFPTRQFTYVMT